MNKRVKQLIKSGAITAGAIAVIAGIAVTDMSAAEAQKDDNGAAIVQKVNAQVVRKEKKQNKIVVKTNDKKIELDVENENNQGDKALNKKENKNINVDVTVKEKNKKELNGKVEYKHPDKSIGINININRDPNFKNNKLDIEVGVNDIVNKKEDDSDIDKSDWAKYDGVTKEQDIKNKADLKVKKDNYKKNEYRLKKDLKNNGIKIEDDLEDILKDKEEVKELIEKIDKLENKVTKVKLKAKINNLRKLKAEIDALDKVILDNDIFISIDKDGNVTVDNRTNNIKDKNIIIGNNRKATVDKNGIVHLDIVINKARPELEDNNKYEDDIEIDFEIRVDNDFGKM